MNYITILWTSTEGSKTDKHDKFFDIVYHETLKNAIIYLIQHGSQFEHQKIVTEVDWLPGETQQNVVPEKATTREVDPGPPPGTVMLGSEQPQVIDAVGSGGSRQIRPGQKSIFENIIPPHILGIMQNDD